MGAAEVQQLTIQIGDHNIYGKMLKDVLKSFKHEILLSFLA